MKVLIDTHIAIWAVLNDPKILPLTVASTEVPIRQQ